MIEMIKENYKKFKKIDIVTPLFHSSLETLNEVLSPMGMEHLMTKIRIEYKQVTIQNTLKLLIRCRIGYGTHRMIQKIFKYYFLFKVSLSTH
jgi:hypothetical protein